MAIHLAVYLQSRLLGKDLPAWAVAFLLGVYCHLFLDLLGAKAADIRIFYPISQKRFSLFPLDSEKGQMSIYSSVRSFSLEECRRCFHSYSENNLLLLLEAAVMTVGFLLAVSGLL